MKAGKLKKIIRAVGEFPTLPMVVSRIMEILNNPYSSASDLTEVISVDQAMTFRILKMANSAYYGFPRAVATVTESIVLLGFTTVKNLILTTMMYNFDQIWSPGGRPKKKDGQALFDQKAEWKHAVATAIAARELMTMQRRESYEHLGYLAGLMHDVGKILLYHYLFDDYQEVLRRRLKKDQEISRLEQKIIGAHHGQVGAWIVDRWNLPEEIVAPIEFHHFPDEARQQRELTRVVYMADHIAHGVDDGTIEEQGFRERVGFHRDFPEVSQEQFQKLGKKIQHEMAEIERFMTK